ncbi:5'-3' exonuclease PLD3 isoform X2 [Hydra vulgaris]|uniref:5'-3' exonuclease PLD3 isoform X2 n=1 Tax=Hydra vulgaris TaxID=6087 RepID=A0ABM4DIW1_HYDVU
MSAYENDLAMTLSTSDETFFADDNLANKRKLEKKNFLNTGIVFKYTVHKWKKRAFIITASLLMVFAIFLVVAYLFSKTKLVVANSKLSFQNDSCNDSQCTLQIVETLPPILAFNNTHDSISKHWLSMINNAKSRIDILSFYWTLKNSDVPGGPYTQAEVGEKIFDALKTSAKNGIKVRIVQSLPTDQFPDLNTKELAELSNVEVRSLDMKYLINAGILHSKVILVDQKNIYIGSANMDWRALTEVKEIGLVLYNCSCAADDLQKIFETNWMLSESGATIPSKWPQKYQTIFNKDRPMLTHINNVLSKLYWSASPPEFCPPNRSSELSSILDLINAAKEFIYISVMDYQAAIIYSQPQTFWPVIDDALRGAVYNRRLTVFILSSLWNYTSPDQIAFLKSLNEFGKISRNNSSLQVKLFKIPSSSIPYTRVSHNKFMVTDNSALVSTSNWSGDYFVSTGGVSLVFNQTGFASPNNVQHKLKKLFLRDWTSRFALNIDKL